MEEKRVDIILSGAILLEEIMDFFGSRSIARTKFALREGLLQQKIDEIETTQKGRWGLPLIL
ncbi:MAG: hypothetical protein COV44_03975 [Deltaproteobacteria bacterium CG11_big_fil_rev_8_21_14_0_20_45_16]|nr:MAG: hypothetical protein COV44_03975 [Deltaproteobacteria bacterium CG11_big_fil_rev_8_21_14_0_20_45_16]